MQKFILKPIRVELVDHQETWMEFAQQLSEQLYRVLGDNLIEVHHIGSTSICGIKAKPIIDLIPVVKDLNILDTKQALVEGLGYGWCGEYGLPGRRYCTKDENRMRVAQLHFYQAGSNEIKRHLAFRDYLRNNPKIAKEYEFIKVECQKKYPNDSYKYGDCKGAWVTKMESRALNSTL